MVPIPSSPRRFFLRPNFFNRESSLSFPKTPAPRAPNFLVYSSNLDINSMSYSVARRQRMAIVPAISGSLCLLLSLAFFNFLPILVTSETFLSALVAILSSSAPFFVILLPNFPAVPTVAFAALLNILLVFFTAPPVNFVVDSAVSKVRCIVCPTKRSVLLLPFLLALAFFKTGLRTYSIRSSFAAYKSLAGMLTSPNGSWPPTVS
mmetsp:Transcript_29996/g.45902  ORF Transcript_29996/g.45902 Transcript_29996/m.45902 type:complete len:206 (+) Transcript_29996:2192-2809(+)